MALSDRQVAGLLLFVGTAQFLVFLVVAEAVYPNYSVSQNFVSDLGVGPAAGIFNGSIIVAGLAVLAASYFLRRALGSWILPLLVAIAGIGAAGVGIFPENVPVLHGLFAALAFVFAGLAALATIRHVGPPLGYVAVVLGVVVLAAFGLFVTRTDLGLGIGGIERMIVLPALAWGMAFGGHLMTPSPKA